MPKSKARKHVTDAVLNSFPIPEDSQKIVRTISIRGSNQIEIEYPQGDKVLCLIPSKFIKKIWIKRGDYLIVDPVSEPDGSSKIMAQVQHILYPPQIKHLKEQGQWPVEFEEKRVLTSEHPKSPKESNQDNNNVSSEDEDNYDDLYVNNNRVVVEDESEEEE